MIPSNDALIYVTKKWKKRGGKKPNETKTWQNVAAQQVRHHVKLSNLQPQGERQEGGKGCRKAIALGQKPQPPIRMRSETNRRVTREGQTTGEIS